MRSARIATRSRRARCRGCSRSTTRFCAPDRRRRRSARWPTSGCSSRSRRSCTTAPPTRCGDRSPRSTPIAAQFESTPDTLTNAILLGSLLVPLGISLHPPRARSRRGCEEDGVGGRPRGRAIRRARGSAICRSRGATSSGCGRSSACSGGCAISAPARARSARWRTAASSAKRSPGWRSTATRRRSSSTGRGSSTSRRRAGTTGAPRTADDDSSRRAAGAAQAPHGDGGGGSAAPHEHDPASSHAASRRLLRTSEFVILNCSLRSGSAATSSIVLYGLASLQRDQQLDDRPRRIDLARA